MSPVPADTQLGQGAAPEISERPLRLWWRPMLLVLIVLASLGAIVFAIKLAPGAVTGGDQEQAR